VIQNFETAARFYRLAADQGFADGQYNYGNAFDEGEGLPQDKAKAVNYYGLAAEQGHAEAQTQLG